MEQKIKQDSINIGGNIRRVRKEKGIGQTELVRMLQLRGVNMTRETLVKIERGIHKGTVAARRKRILALIGELSAHKRRNKPNDSLTASKNIPQVFRIAHI